VSGGPIAQARAGSRPAPIAPTPKVGDVVVPDDFPPGMARWRVVDVPPAAGPSDVVTLEALDPQPGYPSKTRRRIETVRIVHPDDVRGGKSSA
jgi:hypothetical protein